MRFGSRDLFIPFMDDIPVMADIPFIPPIGFMLVIEPYPPIAVIDPIGPIDPIPPMDPMPPIVVIPLIACGEYPILPPIADMADGIGDMEGPIEFMLPPYPPDAMPVPIPVNTQKYAVLN